MSFSSRLAFFYNPIVISKCVYWTGYNKGISSHAGKSSIHFTCIEIRVYMSLCDIPIERTSCFALDKQALLKRVGELKNMVSHNVALISFLGRSC